MGVVTATVRLQLHLSPNSLDRLRRLVEKTDAASLSEVARHSFRLYEALVDEAERGGKVYIESPSGERVEVFAGVEIVTKNS